MLLLLVPCFTFVVSAYIVVCFMIEACQYLGFIIKSSSKILAIKAAAESFEFLSSI
jgi:hypothetical protein